MGNPANSLIARAFAGLPLAPIERAVLRLAEGLGATALIAAAPIVAQALANPTHISYGPTAQAAIGAASTAVLLAVLKFVSAKGDAAPAPTAAPIAAPASLPGPSQIAAHAGQQATISPAGTIAVPAIPANAVPVQQTTNAIGGSL